MSLNPEHFDEFFRALHGDYKPFPWQQELVRRVAAAVDPRGGWPDVLALPTGSGKTTCVDIAVFALACQADRAPGHRTAPRRILFTVDRRVIVDEAYDQAQRLADQLAKAESGILREVADRLRRLAGDKTPLACYELRGGVYRDDGWARTPTQPAVIAATVDQVGSRLLFRSYGRSPRTWPVHAGLAANDSLILLDEAHCAVPFRQTAAAVAEYRRPEWAELPLGVPFVFVQMTATPPPGMSCFTLSESNIKDEELKRRLYAAKPVHLLDPVAGKSGNDKMVTALSREAEKLAECGARRIAVIVNRVQTARLVYRRIRANPDRKVLLIGRMRPLDRDSVMATWQPLLKATRDRQPLSEPVFVVATQCLEVGANLDFDALVSECASLDALRQRFGRLNRMGRDPDARGVLVVAQDDLKEKAQDYVYATALKETWRWLTGHARKEASGELVVDFGILSMDRLWSETLQQDKDAARRFLAPAPDAPVMLPAHVDCWAQTWPVPCPDPDVSIFLHGPGRGAPEVQACWRADLDFEGGKDLPEQRWRNVEEAWIDTLTLCPPAASECMSVPLHVVRRWLMGKDEATNILRDVSDVEGAGEGADAEEPPGESSSRPLPRPVLRWRGTEDARLLHNRGDIDLIRPGDVLVLPLSPSERDVLEKLARNESVGEDLAGGERAESTDSGKKAAENARHEEPPSWDILGHIPLPMGGSPRIDLGDRAFAVSRDRAVLRIHREVIASWPECEARSRLLGLAEADDLPDRIGEPELRKELRECLKQLAVELEPDARSTEHGSGPDPERVWLYTVARHLSRSPRLRERLHPCGWREIEGGTPRQERGLQKTTGGLVLAAPGRIKLSRHARETWGEDEGDVSTRPVPLEEHCARVAEEAFRFAEACGLAAGLAGDLELAGRLHDLGKADPRFQAWLHGGNALAARLAPHLLAKSAGLPQTKRERDRARRRSGYPEKARHELLSVRLVESVPQLLQGAHDPELVYHLIASHHGYCRPLAPVGPDPSREPVRLTYQGHRLTAIGATRLEQLDSGVAERFWRLVRRYGWWGVAYLEAIFILADHRVSEDEVEGRIDLTEVAEEASA